MNFPILGNKCTAEERSEILTAIHHAARKSMDAVADTAYNHLIDQAQKLTDSELLELTRGGEQSTRCCRTLLIATGLEHLEMQYNCEAIKTEVKRAKRWLKNRY